MKQLLIAVGECHKILGMSISTYWRKRNEGILPKPGPHGRVSTVALEAAAAVGDPDPEVLRLGMEAMLKIKAPMVKTDRSQVLAGVAPDDRIVRRYCEKWGLDVYELAVIGKVAQRFRS